ncbi:MAG: sirohydrochlorin cobaltochelatase [Desulfobacterales bacterium]|nr:sirohydrochlorin cobaltochelatase [Desulfobacterales bacterium]
MAGLTVVSRYRVNRNQDTRKMAEEPLPIVLVASGTATAAMDTYRFIEAECRRQLPGHPVHWAYSSRAIRRRMRAQTGEAPATPQKVLDQLSRAGCRRAVVQSLHLICGIEFHHLVWQAAQSPLEVHLGLPLLSHPEDFDAVLDWVDGIRPTTDGEALVLVGHGTDHPAWMAYALLARGLAARFGHQVMLGQVKGEPTPAAIAKRLIASGYRRAQVRPFMLVAGAHFMQDISGRRPTSWQAQLEEHGLTVLPQAEGLGRHAATSRLFCRHIRDALHRPPLHLD